MADSSKWLPLSRARRRYPCSSRHWARRHFAWPVKLPTARFRGYARFPICSIQLCLLCEQRPRLNIVPHRRKSRISFYTKAPFYVHMFAAAGFPIAADGTGVDALVKALVIAGNEAQVEKRVRDLLASGLDELMLMLVPVADEAREREQLIQVIGSL